MDKLSAGLKSMVLARPTNTILRSDKKEIDDIYTTLPRTKPDKAIYLPKEFDGRETWKGCLSPVMNQGGCGSCWAFATTSCLADRFNIQSMGLMNIQLSPTKLILCDFGGAEVDIEHAEEDLIDLSNINKKALDNNACFGNTIFDAFRYLFIFGTCTEECIPYNKNLGLSNEYQKIGSFEEETQLPLCQSVSGPLGDMCANFSIDKKTGEERGTPQRFYKAFHFYTIAGTPKDNGGEYNIRHNIYRWGPVVSGMKIYPNFYTFNPKTEIYEWDGKGEQISGHAVEIVGWGIEEKPFWIIKNSWGTEWGDKGFFKMLRGENNCEIESNVMSAIPDFFYPLGYSLNFRDMSESQEMINTRRNFHIQSNISGGGLDLTTGYTRRVMNTMPWLNFARPVDISNLPDWTNFIAGKDATYQNRKYYKMKIENCKTIIPVRKPSYILAFLMCVTIVLSVILLFLD